jgi:tetratricopeptide (TPR) repeat protein
MPREVPTIPYLGWWPALGLAILLVAALACWQARGRQPVTLAAVAWIAITLFPVSNLVVPTGILVAERTLLLPSVGAMLLVGVAVTALATHGLTVAVAAGVVVAAWAGRTVARLPAWHDSDRLLAASLRDAPRSYKVRWDHARALARAGDTTAAEREFDAALGLYPDDPALLAELGDRRRDAGRCGAAIPFYRQAIAREPARWVTRTRLILCLAREGRRDAAHAELAELERRGEGDPVRLRLTIRADSLMAAPAREGPR